MGDDVYCMCCGECIDGAAGRHCILGGRLRGITPEVAGRAAYLASLPFTPQGFAVTIHPLTPESATAAATPWNPSDAGLVLLSLEGYVCSEACKATAFPLWESTWRDVREFVRQEVPA